MNAKIQSSEVSPHQAQPALRAATVTRGHVPALDGLRGLAILMVLMCHMAMHLHCNSDSAKTLKNVLFSGWTGVDLFFVLSGFLITGILCDSKENPGYFRNFYARRTTRIVPLYLVSLVLLLGIAPALLPLVSHVPRLVRGSTQEWLEGLGRARGMWPWFLGYLVNVLVAWKGFNIWLTQFWSLSVEEHFYLVWPLLVYWLTRRSLIIVSAALVVTAFVLRVAALPFLSGDAIYVLTFFRMDGLALGALLVLFWRVPEHRARLVSLAKVVLPVTGLILLTMFCNRDTNSMYAPTTQTFGYTTSVLFFGSLLMCVLDARWLGAVFEHPLLRFYGKYSYSIYIFHVSWLTILESAFALGDPSHYSVVIKALGRFASSGDTTVTRTALYLDTLGYTFVAIAATTATAIVTWYIIESPCLRLKRYFEYEKKGRLVDEANPITIFAPQVPAVSA